jgi:hypothetical protein
MAEEFGFRDLSGAVFWAVDLSRAHFRDVDLTGVEISHARLVDVSVDAYVERVTINGVDVTDFVNERDAWYPLRALIWADDLDGMRAAWDALGAAWEPTIARASALPPEALHRSVGGEWSFVSTLRHLVFATDKWFTAPILGEGFDPMGIPNTASKDFGWPGLDAEAEPSLAEVLAVRADRAAKLRAFIDGASADDLERDVEVLENGTAPVRECLQTVFEEEFEHHRYAIRDLAQLE